ncbi:MAG: site-specific integrase, partial [bacterium]|nr:site-specific integrase [bacterium]
GMSPRTYTAYSRAVRLLKDYCNKDPWKITEQDVQDYLLYRKNTSKWAPSTLNVALCGIRLNEALNIEVSDIDRKRMVLHIHRGKGAKDRYVPRIN